MIEKAVKVTRSIIAGLSNSRVNDEAARVPPECAPPRSHTATSFSHPKDASDRLQRHEAQRIIEGVCGLNRDAESHAVIGMTTRARAEHYSRVNLFSLQQEAIIGATVPLRHWNSHPATIAAAPSDDRLHQWMTVS